MRETIKTEDPNSTIITKDTLDEDCGDTEGRRKIRLWSADFTPLASWCFTCKQFHKTAGQGV